MSQPPVIPLGAASGPIGAYQGAGGVVEYVLVARDDEDRATRHRTAAEIAMREIRHRHESPGRAPAAARGVEPAVLPAVDVDPSGPVGREVDVGEFVGHAYDWDQRAIISRWERGAGGTASKQGVEPFMTAGYAEAFSDPPYPIRADLGRVNDWFTAINRLLLGGLDDALTVWCWSTDWSTWFDAGHEWWGAFLWTVERDTLPWTAVIAASTTD